MTRVILIVAVSIAIIMSTLTIVITMAPDPVIKSVALKHQPLVTINYDAVANAWVEEHCEFVSASDGNYISYSVGCRFRF